MGASGTVAGQESTVSAFDPHEHLDRLLEPIGLSAASTGGTVSFAGADPIVADRVRLGASIGIPMMANAVGAATLDRIRNGLTQDLHVDLRQAVHHISADKFWKPTLSGELPEHALALDNPFTLDSYRTRDGRTVMASGVYPHQANDWCRFLGVPPDKALVAAAIARWDALELEEAATAAGLPCCIARSPQEWVEHPQGAVLAAQPVIGLRQIGEAPVRDFGRSNRPFDDVRVLSFTHAIAGPVVGRTLAEQGADVLCATIANEYEHTFVYVQANIGSRSTLIDLSTDGGQAIAHELLSGADVVVNNHRPGKLQEFGLDPETLAKRYPGLTSVSVSCYGADGPWAGRPGFDMNGSASSGLMVTEGGIADPHLPITGMINDFITGYMGAAGATAALVKRATVGGSWRVDVNLSRNAMFCQSLGLVDPALAGCDDEHSIREPDAYETRTPLGELRYPAPPVRYSRTPAKWPEPALVYRGSSDPAWLD